MNLAKISYETATSTSGYSFLTVPDDGEISPERCLVTIAGPSRIAGSSGAPGAERCIVPIGIVVARNLVTSRINAIGTLLPSGTKLWFVGNDKLDGRGVPEEPQPVAGEREKALDVWNVCRQRLQGESYIPDTLAPWPV